MLNPARTTSPERSLLAKVPEPVKVRHDLGRTIRQTRLLRRLLRLAEAIEDERRRATETRREAAR